MAQPLQIDYGYYTDYYGPYATINHYVIITRRVYTLLSHYPLE